MNAELDQIPLRCAGAEGSTFGQEFVVLDPPGRMLRGLNETGARVWGLIDGRRTVREIASEIAGEFEVDHAVAETDVRGFISMMSRRGLLQMHVGPEHAGCPEEKAR